MKNNHHLFVSWKIWLNLCDKYLPIQLRTHTENVKNSKYIFKKHWLIYKKTPNLQWARKLKKSKAKKLVKSNKSFFCEIAFLAVLNFFLVQKLIFGHFWNCKKCNLVKRKFREIESFDFTSFFALDFFNFLAHCAFSCTIW